MTEFKEVNIGYQPSPIEIGNYKSIISDNERPQPASSRFGIPYRLPFNHPDLVFLWEKTMPICSLQDIRIDISNPTMIQISISKFIEYCKKSYPNPVLLELFVTIFTNKHVSVLESDRQICKNYIDKLNISPFSRFPSKIPPGYSHAYSVPGITNQNDEI